MELRSCQPHRISGAPGRLFQRARRDRLGDRTRNLLGRFVFPEPQHSPARVYKRAICLGISSDVAFKLGQPVLAVSLGEGGVLRTAMPEATVNEDRYSAFSEDYVSSSAATEGCVVHPISEPSSMEQAADGKFRSGVSSAVSAHGTARPISAGPRHEERLPRGQAGRIDIATQGDLGRSQCLREP